MRGARAPWGRFAGGDKLSAITYREGDPYRDLVKFLGASRPRLGRKAEERNP